VKWLLCVFLAIPVYGCTVEPYTIENDIATRTVPTPKHEQEVLQPGVPRCLGTVASGCMFSLPVKQNVDCTWSYDFVNSERCDMGYTP